MKQEANLLVYSQFQASLISHFIHRYFEKYFNALPLCLILRILSIRKIKFTFHSQFIFRQFHVFPRWRTLSLGSYSTEFWVVKYGIWPSSLAGVTAKLTWVICGSLI